MFGKQASIPNNLFPESTIAKLKRYHPRISRMCDSAHASTTKMQLHHAIAEARPRLIGKQNLLGSS